jgi:hypothetical protein
VPFSHLKPETIREIKKFFTDNEIEYNAQLRSLMLDNVNFEYMQGLRKFDNDSYQLASDLNNLNESTHLADKSLPLEIWLQSGLDLHNHLAGKEVFQKALAEMQAGPAPDTRSDTDKIIVTLEKLSQLIRTNESAYEAVQFYRRTFQTALGEFNEIADYKSMHDTLHQLQLAWTDIIPFLDLLPTNPVMRMTVMNFSPLLENTILKLSEIHARGAVKATEKQWIDELAAEHKQFDTALNEENRAAIEVEFHQVKGQIGKQLSRLNLSLKEAIRVLHLKDLIKAMRELCNVLEGLDAPELASAQVEEYKRGVEEMSVLDEELTKLIIQHDAWQEKDSTLGTFGEMLGENADQPELRNAVSEGTKLTYLNLILNIIETKVYPLLKAKPTKSSTKLMKEVERLKAAIEKKDTDLAVDCFVTYRDQAWHYFFDLDAEMKAKCDELKKIGDKLRKVNEDLVDKPTEV